jgi:oxygen-independent coproporphyrinogen-3 oxidase
MPGVYISYPFCAQKCTYCNFASGVMPRTLGADYLTALAGEMDRHEWAWAPETVYLGGGTPSQIEAADFVHLLGCIPGRPWREATIEVAPGNLDSDRVQAWVEAGIDRISFGVQSFVAAELARTGRKHRAENVQENVAFVRENGLNRLNLDLICGLPGQTPQSWDESLDWIERLQPDHVSVYMLEVDEDSRLGREILVNGSRFGAQSVPSEDLTADLYEHAADRLAAMGLPRYEISNFARPGSESAHNLKYWRREPYVGFGADAHSFDGEYRKQNVESAAEYVDRSRSGRPLVVGWERAIEAEEKFFLGLRLAEGIRPTNEDAGRYGKLLHRFLVDGLLDTDGQRFWLTRRGVLLSNEVFSEFIGVPV